VLPKFDRMDVTGNIDSRPVDIRNLSAPAHVESHAETLRNYGHKISASSLVHEGNGFVIRMYAFDHNPPHFHILLRRNTSEWI
jgi:hypothetical protein